MYLRSAYSLFRYQSTVLGSYQTVELIETFMNYQVLFKIMSTIVPCDYNILDLIYSYVMLDISMYSMATLLYNRYIGIYSSVKVDCKV